MPWRPHPYGKPTGGGMPSPSKTTSTLAILDGGRADLAPANTLDAGADLAEYGDTVDGGTP